MSDDEWRRHVEKVVVRIYAKHPDLLKMLELAKVAYTKEFYDVHERSGYTLAETLRPIRRKLIAMRDREPLHP